MSKKQIKALAGIALLLIVLMIAVGCTAYVNRHTFTLSGDEQIQPVTGTVKVTSPRDTEVIFIDVKTGVNIAIPFISAGESETVKLEKGKWYTIETGEGLTLSLVNVRIA